MNSHDALIMMSGHLGAIADQDFIELPLRLVIPQNDLNGKVLAVTF
ncbi:hypothetical protein [Rheinheimera sp. SA_1]|nr:hypothetical protein [Rheinheimera sp. SA_1]